MLRSNRGPLLVGDLPAYLRDKLGFLMRRTQVPGEHPVELRLGGRTLLLRSPADVRHVLVQAAAIYEKSPRLTDRRGQKLYEGSLLAMRNRENHLLRRMVQPAFHRELAEVLVAEAAPWVDAMLGAWSKCSEVDVSAHLTSLAERMSATVLFGSDGARELADLREFAFARRQFVELRLGLPVPGMEYLPLGALRRYRQQARIWIPRLRERIAAAKATGASGLVGALFHRCGVNGPAIQEEQALAEVIVLLLAGFESTAEWLVWTLLLVAEHPQNQLDLQRELAQHGKHAAPPLAPSPGLPSAILEKGSLLERTVKESLRLYPPTWLFVRVAMQPDRLPSGVEVEAGTKIYVCPYTLHRSERHFPDAERFLPQRFSTHAAQSFPSDAFVPFGLGPRRCLGESIAYLEAKLVVSRILERFTLRRADDGPIRPHAGVTLRARDRVMLALEPR